MFNSNSDSDYEFNWKAALVTLVTLLVLAPCVFFLHRKQVGRLEKHLLGEIESAKSSGDQDQTITRLNRYLVYQPEAPKQKVELTELLANPKNPKLPPEALIPLIYQAIAACEQHSELEDKLPDLREKLLENLSQSMRTGEAVEQIAKLAKEELDPELDKKLALLRYRGLVVAGEDPSIGRLLPGTAAWIAKQCKLDPIDHLQGALKELKGDVALTAMLGNACIIDPSKLVRSNLGKLDKQELESFILRKLPEMIERHGDDPDAWLVDYQILSRIDSKKAGQDIATALEKFPDNTSILQQAAVHKMGVIFSAKRTGNEELIGDELKETEGILEKIKNGSGIRSPFTYSSLSELALVKGEKDKAIQFLEDGLRVCQPPLVDLRLRMAQIYNQFNDSNMALDALKKADETLRQDSARLNGVQQTEFARAIKQQWLEYYNSQGNLVAVSEQLDSLLVTTASSDTNTELRIQAFAAEAFRKIGYWDKASNSYLRALALAPSNDKLRRGAAESLVKANRTADAIKQYELIQNKLPGDWMQYALLQMLVQRTDLSFEDNQWKSIQTALDRARETALAGTQDSGFLILLDVLQADLDVRKTPPSKRSETIEAWKPKLLELCRTNPTKELLLKNVNNLLGIWGELESASEVRKLLIEQNPESLDAHLEHATSLAKSGQIKEALDYMVDRLPEFPQNVRLNQFIVGLMPIDDAFGPRVQKMLEACGTNYSVMSDLCEYLLRVPQYTGEVSDKDKAKSMPKLAIWNAAMQNAEMQLRKLEGEKGTGWRYTKARRLLTKSLFDEKPDFVSVSELIQQIEEARPDWAYIQVLRGALSEQMKEPAKAIKAYQAAVGLAIDDIRAYERLIELLYQEGRFEEAEAYISRLGQVSNQSNRIASVALRLSEKNQASTLDIARLGTEARPLDPFAWIWYARVVELSSREIDAQERQASLKQVETYFQRARQLAPDQCEPIRAMFQHYALTRQTTEMEQLVEQVQSDTKLVPIHERWNMLGGMYLYLNKLEQAEDCLNKSISSGGDVASNSLLKAEIMVRLGRQIEAIEFLTEVTKNKPEIAEVRQSLATILASRGTPADWKQIEDVLTAPPYGNSIEDRLLHARLLMSRRSYADLEKAREKLQAVAGVKSQYSNDVLFTLGVINRYLLDLSNRDKLISTDTRSYQEAAESALQKAAMSMPPNENFITGYASFLIERNKLNDVKALIDKLLTLAPKSRGTSLVRILWHQAQGQKDSAREVVLEWFANTAKVDYSPSLDLSEVSGDTLAFSNALFEAIEDQENADRTFEAIIDRSPLIARNYLNSLLRHDISRIRNAGLRRITQHFDELNLTPIDTSIILSVISSLQFDQDKTKALIELLSKKIDESKDVDMITLVSIGDFFLAKQAAPESLKCYRMIFEKEPKNPGTLNNLANILIEISPENAKEALEYIDKAVEILPDNSVLLDTKGTVLILLKRYDEAAQALSVATKKGGDPRSALHWYMALIKSGKTEEAQKVKLMIDKKTLRDVYLLPEDKALLEKL
jgi:predicted Zn-dependent protease